MRSLIALALLALTVPAQNVDIIGGLTTAPSGANRGKASVYAVTNSVLLTEYEMHLNVPGPETLTFFLYRHHSRTGVANLVWSLPVTVAGGIGPSWYSTGPIALPLVAGNFYMIGVAWAGTITYYYSTGAGGTPVSFGTWERAHTLSNVSTPPPTYTIVSGVDIAQYYQRLTTIPIPAVVNTGTPCSGTTLLPRLVGDSFFTVGATSNLELVDTAASSIVLFGLAGGPAIGTPLPLFGCSLWLDITGVLVQGARLLPVVRRAADGRDGGVALRRGDSGGAGAAVGAVAAVSRAGRVCVRRGRVCRGAAGAGGHGVGLLRTGGATCRVAAATDGGGGVRAAVRFGFAGEPAQPRERGTCCGWMACMRGNLVARRCSPSTAS